LVGPALGGGGRVAAVCEAEDVADEEEELLLLSLLPAVADDPLDESVVGVEPESEVVAGPRE